MSPRIEQALPKYLQIANYIRAQISRGELKPGDPVPSERQIVETWHVSRPTATRALAALRADGLIRSRQGFGSVVRIRPSRSARDLYGQSRRTGHIYASGEYAKIQRAELVPAPEEVALALELPEGEPVIRRDRVTYSAEHAPVGASTSWFAGDLADVASRLLERERIREGTLAYVEQQTGRRARTYRARTSARLASESESKALELPEPAAVLVVRNTVLDAKESPLTYEVGIYPPEHDLFEEEGPLDEA